MCRIAGIVCAALLTLAAYWSLRLAYADSLARTSSRASLRKSLLLTPGNAAYWLRWASVSEEAGERSAALERAAALNPYNATAWIEAGMLAETRGDFASAESHLLHAAQISRQYQPRWTLANYYFRRGDAEHFWPWVKSALEWSYQDRHSLFGLCWNMTNDAGRILEKGIPSGIRIQRDYLTFLLAEGHLEAATAVSPALERQAAAPEDRAVLVQYTGRMLDERRWDAALASWNALCTRKLLPYAPLMPYRGVSLTNAAFAMEPLNAGFDWRTPALTGISIVRGNSPPFLRIAFSGKQPESCEVLQQLIPVAPGANYRLRFEFRTSGIRPGAGLQWKIFDAAGTEVKSLSPHLANEQWENEGVSFTAPAEPRVLRLALAYRRMPGTTRIEGDVWLRNLRLDFEP